MSDEDRLLIITCVSAAVLLVVWFWLV